jgi:hypothetical protein
MQINCSKTFLAMFRTFLSILLIGLSLSAKSQLIINEVLYDPSNTGLEGDALTGIPFTDVPRLLARCALPTTLRAAIDAAVAVQFALAVVYPQAGNIGGGGFLIYRGKTGVLDALDYREKAPAGATETMYQDSLGRVQNKKIRFGALAAGVPGTVDGMWEAHKKYGKLKWYELIKPATQLAEKGFQITAQEANNLNSERMNFVINCSILPAFVKWKSGKRATGSSKKNWPVPCDGSKGPVEMASTRAPPHSLSSKIWKNAKALLPKKTSTTTKVSGENPSTLNGMDSELSQCPLPAVAASSSNNS